MGRHRQRDSRRTPELERYERLLVALHLHRPGPRSGVCVRCGVPWPCTNVMEPMALPVDEEHEPEGP